jgi:hypothetical protein
MRLPGWWKLAVLWAFSLMLASGVTAFAQGRRGVPPAPDAFVLESPTILTGPDVGFRLERVRDGVPVGHVVVKVDGRWVEPQAR